MKRGRECRFPHYHIENAVSLNSGYGPLCPSDRLSLAYDATMRAFLCKDPYGDALRFKFPGVDVSSLPVQSAPSSHCTSRSVSQAIPALF
jgi:hypothetical protein